MQKRAIILINVGAGSDDKNDELRRQIETGFKNSPIDVDIKFLRGGGEIEKIIEKSVAEKPDIIVAGGGDGTLNAVASKLLKTKIILGILPLGTLNHFAKDAGIPLKIEDAVGNIISGNIKHVDVAEVNGKVFLNNSGIGIYPDIVAQRQKVQSRGHGKWTSFSLAFLAVLKKYPMVRVKIEMDDKTILQKTPFVFIGNNLYRMAGFRMGGRDKLDDGKLSLFIVHRTGKRGLLRLAFKALLGIVQQDKDFDAFNVEEIIIESDEPVLKVSTDGEVAEMKTPLQYKILPKALSVILPAKTFTK
ncbi:MAG TPA: diacylglycerol kinase family protein [Patescibacteria group bacterium]|nr:diacylglycerol kinase family protein [Patescibacteria group bacterium]